MDDATSLKTSAVTRVEIVLPGGLSGGEYWADSWDFHLQDDGRTLKAFAKGSGASAHTTRSAELGAEIRKINDAIRDGLDWTGKVNGPEL